MQREQLIWDMAAGIVHYENAEIPLRIKEYTIDDNVEERNIPHWHDDFELVQVLEGVCEYTINEDKIYLQKGDFLFLNTKVMHKSHRYSTSPLRARCLLFQPKILSSNAMIKERYIEPVWVTNPVEYIYFPRNTDETSKCLFWMNEIYNARNKNLPAYELEALAGLHGIMACIYRHISEIAPAIYQKSKTADLEKKMLSFIYQHYKEKITLGDIAAAGNIGKHRCCEIFREKTGYTPIEYLNFYRLQVASRVLLSGDKTIQEIAGGCGFESAAYFTKQFRNQFQQTPKEYRKLHG